MKRLFMLCLTAIVLLSLTACNGYNRIMREHLSNKNNYYDVDAVFCSYKETDDRMYLYVTVEDPSAFDSSESNAEKIALVLVGDNSDALRAPLSTKELCEGTEITVKCSTWIYMDTSFYYIAEIKTQNQTFLSFEDGLKNIIRYMDDNASLF